jgi:uncharacterized lipoprotein YajG
MSKIKYGLIVGAAAFALAGCGADQSREDANDAHCVGACKAAPEVITFNNHFPNIETKCDGHGHRVYVTTHDSATGNNVLVIDDAGCGGSSN